MPGRHRAQDASRSFPGATVTAQPTAATGGRKAPLRGAAVVGGADEAEVAARLEQLAAEASAGRAPAPAPPDPALAGAAVRVAIDYADAADLATKAAKAVQALQGGGNPAMWRILRAQGVFVGRGAPGKVAFLYTGQGSQYVNMLAGPAPARADSRRDVRRGRPGHGTAAGQAADCFHLRRRQRRNRCATAGTAAHADRDHATGGAGHRSGPDPDARRVRRSSGHGHGPQLGRVRRPGGRGRAVVRRRPGGGQRPGPGDGEPVDCRQRRHGGCVRPTGRDRPDRGRDRRVRRGCEHQQQRPGRHRRCHRCRGPRRRGFPRRRHERQPNPGQPRFPHRDRGAGERTAEDRTAPARHAAAASADRVERDRRVLSGGRRRRHHARPARPPGGVAGPVRRRTPHVAFGGCPHLRRGRPEEGAARLRRGRPRRRCAGPVHQPPENGRCRLVQPGVVRAVRRRARVRPAFRRSRGHPGRSRHRGRCRPSQRGPQ